MEDKLKVARSLGLTGAELDELARARDILEKFFSQAGVSVPTKPVEIADRGRCEFFCSGTCVGDCDGSCKDGCKESCSDSCAGSCADACSKTCKGDCVSSCRSVERP